jgi:hypothetical protein
MRRLLITGAALIGLSLSFQARAQVAGSAAGGQAANQSSLGGCIYRSSPLALTSGQQAGVNCDAGGRLVVNTYGSPGSALTPLGYSQLTPTSAIGLSAPAGSLICIVQAEGQTIRYRDDGTAPTTTVGMQILPGGVLTASGAAEIAAVQIIQTATGGLVDLSCYK